MTLTRLRIVLGLSALVLLVPVIFLLYRHTHTDFPPALPSPDLPQDTLFHPDVVIQSSALSQLPKDILAVPLLKDLLTEEFVFYYETNESRLSLEGTFRRIAYERDMGIGDEIISYALNTPAEVALWKNRDGKLSNYLLIIPKKGLMRFVEPLARIALDDTQLKSEYTIEIDGSGSSSGGGGEKYTVWRLQHTTKRAIFFVALKEHIAVFTDQSLMDTTPSAEKQDEKNRDAKKLDGKRRDKISQFIKNLGPNTLGSWMRLPPLSSKHTIAAGTSFLSFGYQYFFPALETIRFDYNRHGTDGHWLSSTTKSENSIIAAVSKYFSASKNSNQKDDEKNNAKGWTTSVLSSAPSASPDSLWSRIPASPALSVALPVEKSRLLKYLKLFSSSPELPELVERLSPPAALCWYGDSRLHTPLAVFPLSETKESWIPLLTEIFTKSVGTSEADGNLLPVEESVYEGDKGHIWQRSVSSPHGILDSGQSPERKEMRSRRYFRVTLALAGNTLIFSPDATLVDRAHAVLSKNYPPMTDIIGKSTPSVSAAIVPESLALLLKKALSESLPPTREPVFRTSVEKRFFPLLETVAKLPPSLLSTPHETNVWEPLSWHDIYSP